MQTLAARLTFSSVLAATMAASTFSLVVYSVLAADLLAEYDIERWQVGLMVTATTLAGAVASPFVGVLTDRIGARRAAILTLVGSAAALAAIGAAPSYVLLTAAAVVSGVFQAVANPSTNKLIAEHVKSGTRGIITGVKQSGVQVGTFIGGLALPWLAGLFDWRIAVLVFAAGAFAWGLVAALTLPGDIDVPDLADGDAGTQLPRLIARLAVYGFLLGAGGTAIFTYLPLFGQETLGLSALAAGAAAALVGLSGVFARIWWGRLAELRLGSERSLRIMAIGAIGAAATLYAAPWAGWLIWVAAIITGFTASAWNAVGMLAVIQSVPSQLAGKGSGVVLLGFLLGLGIGSPIMGWSVDTTGSYQPGWLAISLLFAAGWWTLRPERRVRA